MKKSQTPRVQHLSGIVAGVFPVHFVPQDRMADRVEMDANLVGSSGENLAKNQSPLAGVLDHLKPGVGWPATIDDGHLLALYWMTTDRLDNFAGRFRESTDAQGQIKFLNFSSGKLVAQSQMREVVFGDHQATTGFFVKPVDYARAKMTADPAQIGDLMQQCVDQGAGLHARSGVNRHPGRLVDDQ